MHQNVKKFLTLAIREGHKRPGTVAIGSAPNQRIFSCYDWGGDSFVIERAILQARNDLRLPITIIAKRCFQRGAGGYIFSVSSGNHSITAMALFNGLFWNLGHIPKSEQSHTLTTQVVCANIVNATIEISQRDVPIETLVAVDEWLHSLGVPLNQIVFCDRTQSALDYYRRLGQEWRIKPLAWTKSEMAGVLAINHRRIGSGIYYYYNVRGVHFLTYGEFVRVVDLARCQPATAKGVLHYWVGVETNQHLSYMRFPKYQAHHEIEFFGLPDGYAIRTLVPELEQIMEDLVLKRIPLSALSERLAAVGETFRRALVNPDYADEKSDAFTVAMYRHITGNIYNTAGTFETQSFDDRRTALPGVTFLGGRPEYHPGIDLRTRHIVSRLTQTLNCDERIEHLNVYEIRSATQEIPLGEGGTREIIVKTNRHPYPYSLIEKELASAHTGYASYMLARANAFRALGSCYSEYFLATPENDIDGRPNRRQFLIRRRCPGYPLDGIPKSYYLHQPTAGQDAPPREDLDVVRGVVRLLGEVAAQNMIAKKYTASDRSCRFGVGKEIFEFNYDARKGKVLPQTVRVCSIRGIMGWPDLSQTTENQQRANAFYLSAFASVLRDYWLRHNADLTLPEIAECFFDGFTAKTNGMFWKYQMRSYDFDSFDPNLRPQYKFREKWTFVLWSLCRQHEHILTLKDLFLETVQNLPATPEKL